jgi:hypothetical protein
MDGRPLLLKGIRNAVIIELVVAVIVFVLI